MTAPDLSVQAFDEPQQQRSVERGRIGRGHRAWAWGCSGWAAILDRLLHRSQVITTRGESYHLRGQRRSGLFQVDLSPRPRGAEGAP